MPENPSFPNLRKVAGESVEKALKTPPEIVYPEPELDFVDPSKVAEFLGKQWKVAGESQGKYFFRYLKRNGRFLQLGFPKYRNGAFTAETSSGGPFIAITHVNQLELNPGRVTAEGQPETEKDIQVTSPTSSFHVKMRNLNVYLMSPEAQVFIKFNNDLRRPL